MSNTIQKHSKRKAQLTIKFGFSKQFFIYYIIICIGFCTASCIENKQTNSLQYNTKAWNKIKDYFNPPVIYKDNRMYLQPIITQYFIDNKSEIWLLFLIAHSKR